MQISRRSMRGCAWRVSATNDSVPGTDGSLLGFGMTIAAITFNWPV